MSITSETEERIISKNGADSPSVEEDCSGGNSGGNGPLKKGPWTSAEDSILVQYVTRHGEGNWNAVQKHSSLARCGKSCRLRWANHLRPDLKKGAFTPEEEQRIIELHARMGNKWARMAVESSGRTDNEIKNFWNTRMKRRQRTGLPIYPSEICFQTLNENQGNEDFGTFSQHHNLSTISNFEIPAVEFKYLERNQQLYTPTIRDVPQTSLLDIPAINLLEQGLNPSYSGKSALSTFYPSKRFRGSESLYPSLNAPVYDVAPGRIQYLNDGLVLIAQSFALPSAYENNSNSDHPPFSSSIHGYRSALNGNSSSEPGWVMKLELPSLQTQTGNRGSPSSPLPPSRECVDTLIQTTQTENTQSCSLSPRNSGLLDSVLYESQNIKHSKNNSCEQTSHASVMAIDVMDTSPHDLLDTQWEAYGDPISPLGHSSFSFREYTISSRNPLDETQAFETMTGCYVKEVVEPVPMQYNNTETTNLTIFSRPDFLLGSFNCFVPNNDQTREHSLLKDAFGPFRVEDLSRDCKQMDSGATSSAKKCGGIVLGHGILCLLSSQLFLIEKIPFIKLVRTFSTVVFPW